MRSSLGSWLAAIVLSTQLPAVFAQCHQTELIGPTVPGAHFGAAADGDLGEFAVGAPGADSVSVYVLNAGQWNQEAVLTGPAGTRFGASVAILGDRLAVGAPGEDQGSAVAAGAVHVFSRTAPGVWTLDSVLTATQPGTDNNFGSAMAMHADRLMVGEPGFSNRKGRVRIFRHDGTTFQPEQVLNTFLMNGAEFGAAVDITDEFAIVGAPLDSNSGFSKNGAVLFYRRVGTNWIGAGNLTLPATNSNTGAAVATDGTHAAFSVPGLSSAYDYEWNGSQFVLFDWLSGSKGYATAMDMVGTRLLVSQPKDDPVFADDPITGYCLAYERGSSDYPFTKGFYRLEGSVDDVFGASVALAGSYAVVGTPNADPGAVDAGAVYHYDLSIPDGEWTKHNNAGTVAAVMWGKGSLCPGEPLRIYVNTGAANSPAFLVVGLSAVNLPLLGATLVPSPDFVLAGFMTDSAGDFSFEATLPANTPPGISFYLQAFAPTTFLQGYLITNGLQGAIN